MLRPIQVRQYLNFMHARGIPSDAVLAGTTLQESRLTDPTYLVNSSECHRVVSNLISLSGDAGIGLKIGKATKLHDLGIVGYAMASANTFGQALEIWVRYANSPLGVPFNLNILENPGPSRWGIAAAPTGISGSVYRFYMEEVITMGLRIASLITGRHIPLVELAFSYPAPPHRRQYESLFKCKIEFDSVLTRVVGQASSLALPIKSNDSELREVCLQHCTTLLRRISSHGPISSRLRAALTTMGSIPTLDTAAAALNMSARSLRRRLQHEGTTFQLVLDEFRRELAQEYLGAGHMHAKEVAHLLGFSQVGTFRRAFKTWTGNTVAHFQLPLRKAADHGAQEAAARRPESPAGRGGPARVSKHKGLRKFS